MRDEFLTINTITETSPPRGYTGLVLTPWRQALAWAVWINGNICTYTNSQRLASGILRSERSHLQEA